jgi:hypothetical protein
LAVFLETRLVRIFKDMWKRVAHIIWLFSFLLS